MLTAQRLERDESRRSTLVTMPRERDPLWDHVTIAAAYGTSGTKRWTCKYCHNSYTGGPTRIRAHLLHLRGHDIGPCTHAPDSILTPVGTASASDEAGPSRFGPRVRGIYSTLILR